MTDTIKLPRHPEKYFEWTASEAEAILNWGRSLTAEAVAAEREACAQIVDECVRMVDGADAVAAIRARSTT